jgi:hypothetical protein
MTQFESRLQECLEALREGRWELGDCLRRYPDDADALRPLLITAIAAAQTFDAVQPREAFVRSARERFLVASGQRLQEAMDVEPEPSFFAAARVRFLMTAQRMKLGERAERRPVRVPLFGSPARALGSAMAGIALFLSFSTYTVASASNSIPGDWQYGVKLQTERVRLALAFSDESKRDVKLDIAEERVSEIKEMSQRGKIIGPGVLDRLVETTQPLVEDARQGDWDLDEAARLQGITQTQGLVLTDGDTKIDPAAGVELQQAEEIAKTGAIFATQLIYQDPARPPAVLTPSIPLTNTAIPTNDIEPPATETPEPTATEGSGDVTPVATTTPIGISFDQSKPVQTRNSVKLYQVTAGKLTFLAPGAATEGWHLVFDDTLPGVPTLVKLSNGDGTSLVTLNVRNGDMYWYINANGRFDEVQMRIQKQDGTVNVADRDVLTAAYGDASDIPYYMLTTIALAPDDTPTPSPTDTPAAAPVTAETPAP